MKTLFEKLSTPGRLSQKEAYNLMLLVNENNFNPTQLSALLAFYIKRPVTVDELCGFRNALLDLSIKITLEKEAIDVCGTGGDQKNTFNISTLSALVLAASGIPVAKHGNNGSSSVSGSSDILNYFGYKFKTTSGEINQELNNYNLTFIHAPLFHPALKMVAQPRKEIGIRTFFNLLGPLVNPARVNYQYIGVYNLEVARLYNYVLQNGKSNYRIVHSTAGFDEISLTSSFKIISNESENIYEPYDLGYSTLCDKDLFAGTTIKAAAEIFLNVLSGKASQAQEQVVVVNSAIAMNCFSPKTSIEDCIQTCKDTLDSKKALLLFKDLINQN